LHHYMYMYVFKTKKMDVANRCNNKEERRHLDKKSL